MTEKPKLNKESLEKHFPKVEIPRMHYDYDFSLLDYKPPILLKVEQAVKAFNLQVENEVYKVVRNYEINVDKDELLKALRYDRNQYDLGYRAGYSKAYSIIREIFGELEASFCTLAYPVVTAVGTVVTERAEGLHISSEDYEAIKKRYTEERNNDGE